MTTPTDLRAALRDAINMIPTPGGGDAEHDRLLKIEHLRALADAPPTVAELLPMVDAGHEVRWTDADGDDACATMDGETDPDADILYFRREPGWCGADHDGWSMSKMRRPDLTAPGRLVEVSP